MYELSVSEKRAFAKGVERGRKTERKTCLLLVVAFVVVFEFLNVLMVVLLLKFAC